ncbi:glycosyltransferase family 2 protein [Thiolapillus brandeum]|uniref:Glycosyl transferase family 2 n=1 Tax=Thiolapillus brandeum TaxID=1076588 RepID=A0A7U6JJ52_9GAMM|nr:glycosyltransferase family A protein [Thiolapillus brandeum]BAO45442.1 glycosyl transferase family 2 [Thiolapillus brandeum]
MEQQDYFISVVIPNYNYEKYVGEAIRSVLDQTWNNREVVVVDDGSTDDSVRVIRKFGDKVRLIRQENQHLSAARNTGIRAAKGNWIAFLDSDDLWHPCKLELQVEALKKNPDWAFIGGDVLDEGDYPDFDKATIQEEEVTLNDFLAYTPMSGSVALVKTECFNKVGMFDPGLRSSEDLDMWLRLASAYRGGRVKAPLWHYRQHPDQMNRDMGTMLTTRKQVMSRFFHKHHIPFSQRRIAWAQYMYDAAITHRDNGGNLGRSLAYGLGSLLYAPESYHAEASTGERLKSEIVTLLRLLRIHKPGETHDH